MLKTTLFELSDIDHGPLCSIYELGIEERF